MEILNTNIKDSKELYKFTHSPEAQKMRTKEGKEIHFGKYAIYMDADRRTGEAQKICAIENLADGKMYATNSVTFCRSFEDIVTMVDGASVVKVVGGTSKNGRPYIDCVLVD